MAYGRKRGLDWVCGADARPMLGRESVKGHQLFIVFFQAVCGFRVFVLVGVNKQIKGLARIIFGLGLPDVVQIALGFWLNRLWPIVQYVGSLVYPAPLLLGVWVNLFDRIPES